MWFKSRFTVPMVVAMSCCLIGDTNPASAYVDLGDQLFKLLADDGAADDHFGFSVATSGDTAIVGARWDDDNGDFSGSAYLFDTTTGQQIAKLLPDDRAVGFNFGWSVAISDATVLVGAPGDDHSGNSSGSVYVFDTATGRQIAKLLADDAHPGAFFGGAVAINGPLGKEVAIVGAWADDHATGSAYLFDISDPGNPVQTAKLLAIDGEEDDDFGISVAISGATAIVGAWFDNHNGTLSGSAYLFDTTTGQQIAKLLPDDGAAFDLFGQAVAIGGPPGKEVAFVGAGADDDNGSGSGSVYLFDISDPKNPVEIAKMLPNDGMTGDVFGARVAISGATAIIGTRLDDDRGPDSGSAYLFDISDPKNPVQISKVLANDGAAGDEFGHSVAISGPAGKEVVIVGARWDDDNGAQSGSAYLFDAADPGKCPWDLNNDDVVGTTDLLILLGAWGKNPGHPSDFDGDGNVGAVDLIELLGNWGPC